MSNHSSVERQRRHIPATIHQHHSLTLVHSHSCQQEEDRGEVSNHHHLRRKNRKAFLIFNRTCQPVAETCFSDQKLTLMWICLMTASCLQGSIWTKGNSPPRLLHSCQRAKVQNLNADLVDCFFPCSLKLVQVVQLTASSLPLLHSWADTQGEETVLTLFTPLVTQRTVFCDCSQGLWQTSSTTLLISLVEVMFSLRASADAAVIFIRWPALLQPLSLRLAGRLRCLSLYEVVKKHRFLENHHMPRMLFVARAKLKICHACKEL